MADPVFGVTGAGAALVPDDTYGDVARGMIGRSRGYCLATLFIVDLDPAGDTDLRVDGMVQEMAAAAWRGVDARLIVGGSRVNGDILDMARLARARARSLGLPCRMVATTEQISNHSKVLVADGVTLLGSHNWSPGALTGQRQDSVAITSAVFAAYQLSRFAAQWATAGAEGFDVPD
ncbi:phospholipase D-like domain-containing protein [Rhodophyticola sp.]|jgi:phosphatidylserine/phosphatidylglycerophosphate/cardiolipin synthase-like enzyme|uniref:phospholipase D-like domain-containing protein n=1 Tax=Rhodophyticola sp. TaxID=2680032 RepID=UPI003D28267A